MNNNDELLRYLANHRLDYGKEHAEENTAGNNPFQIFGEWFAKALQNSLVEPHAMNLATAGNGGTVSSRIVLLRDYTEGGFTFFTNYESRKGKDLEYNNRCALNFFWPPLEKQIRIEGTVEKLEEAESSAYFDTRPRESQIGAWASTQSELLESRELLELKVKYFTQQFEGREVPRPPQWGGYVVKPYYFEFWQGRENRLHSRVVFRKEENSRLWHKYMIQP